MSMWCTGSFSCAPDRVPRRDAAPVAPAAPTPAPPVPLGTTARFAAVLEAAALLDVGTDTAAADAPLPLTPPAPPAPPGAAPPFLAGCVAVGCGFLPCSSAFLARCASYAPGRARQPSSSPSPTGAVCCSSQRPTVVLVSLVVRPWSCVVSASLLQLYPHQRRHYCSLWRSWLWRQKHHRRASQRLPVAAAP